MPDRPWQLEATEALRCLREGSLGVRELVQSVAERAHAVQPAVNALTSLSLNHFDEALELADAAETRYRRGRNRPLEGLPVAIKEDTDVAGQPTTHGSILFLANMPEHDAPIVERLRNAGAVVLGRTTAPEFSCAAVTHGPLHGVTRNPWDPNLTPGGSSGGAGAALASGAAMLATGTDMAGSLRNPAAACGVVGFKPSRGRIPVDPARAQDPLFHCGPMARSVADCRLTYNATCGPHPRDMTSLRPSPAIGEDPPDIRGWRIACSATLGLGEADPDVAQNLEHLAKALAAAGAVVEWVDPAWPEDLLDTAHTLIAWLHGERIRLHLPRHRATLAPYTRAFAARAGRVRPADRLHAMVTVSHAAGALDAVLARNRVLVCPTLAVPAVAADHDPVRGELRVLGRQLDPALGWTLTWPFNLLSAHPVLAVPSGMTAWGTPLGVQVVGRRHADADVVAIGCAIEAVRGGIEFPFAGVPLGQLPA